MECVSHTHLMNERRFHRPQTIADLELDYFVIMFFLFFNRARLLLLLFIILLPLALLCK